MGHIGKNIGWAWCSWKADRGGAVLSAARQLVLLFRSSSVSQEGLPNTLASVRHSVADTIIKSDVCVCVGGGKGGVRNAHKKRVK